MKHIFQRIILIITALCLIAGMTAAEEEDPATPTNLEPTPQGLIEEEIRKRDLSPNETVKIEVPEGTRVYF